MTRVAALDVGTNTVLCLVAERGVSSSTPLLRVSDEARITRLGEGVALHGHLSDAAIDRTIEAVRMLAARARAAGATRLVGVGTSALRDAADRERFVALARQILNKFEVIPGLREAELTFRGALPGLVAPGEHTVVDIGGGSTEIAIGDTAPTKRTSLQLGSVRLSERLASSPDPLDDAAIRATRDAIDRALDEARVADLPPIVALAGTATTVASFVLGIPFADVHAVHGRTVHRDALVRAAADLAAMPLAERRSLPSVEPGRADVLPVGALLLARIAERSTSPSVTISDGGLRWALAEDTLATL